MKNYENKTNNLLFAHGTGSFKPAVIGSILKDGCLYHGKGSIQYGRLVSEMYSAYGGFLFVDIFNKGKEKDRRMEINDEGVAIRPLETLDYIVVPEEHIATLQKIFPNYKKKLIAFVDLAKKLRSETKK